MFLPLFSPTAYFTCLSLCHPFLSFTYPSVSINSPFFSLLPYPSISLLPTLFLLLSLFLPHPTLPQVIYSLNMKNEEQESALQTLTYAHQEELHRIVMETCHEGEGSVLRTRLLELQESLDQQQRVGAQVRGSP